MNGKVVKMGDATDQIWTHPEVSCHELKDTQVTKQAGFNFARQHNGKSSGYRIVPSRNAYSFYYKDYCSPHGIKTAGGAIPSQSTLCKDVMQTERLASIHNSYGNMQNSFRAITEATHTEEKQESLHLQKVDDANDATKKIEKVNEEGVLFHSFKSVEVIVHDTSVFSKDYDNLLENHSPVRIRQQIQRDAQGARCNWVVKEQRLWLYQCPYRYRQVNKNKRVSIPCGIPLPQGTTQEGIPTDGRSHLVNGNNISRITQSVCDSQQHQNQNAVIPGCKHYLIGAKKDKRFTLSFSAILRRSFRIGCLKVSMFTKSTIVCLIVGMVSNNDLLR